MMSKWVGTVKSWLGWWCWARVPPPRKQTTATGSWVKLRSLHDRPPLSDLRQVPSTLGRPPRHDRKSRHSWTRTTGIFSLCPACSVFEEPPSCPPKSLASSGRFPGTAPHPGPGAPDPGPVSKNQFLLMKNAAPSPTHTEAVAQNPEGVRHRICDLGQVMFWTLKLGEGDLVWCRGPPDETGPPDWTVAEVSGDLGQRHPQTGAPLGRLCCAKEESLLAFRGQMRVPGKLPLGLG